MKWEVVPTVLVCALSLLASEAAFGGESSQIEVRKAALFKNGYGFVAGVVETTLGLDTVVISGPPEAMLGTFWLGSMANGASVVSVCLEDDPESAVRPVRDLAEMLTSNPGRDVTITTDKDELTGTLLSADPSSLPEPRFDSGTGATVERSAPEICLLNTAEGLLALRMSEIRALRFAGEAVTTVAAEEKAKRLVCRFDRASDGGELPIHFFQKGISWLPAYEIELATDKQARVRMRGSIINDAIDLNEAQVSFIAGHPNLRFSTMPEVVTGRISADEFYQQLASALTPSRFGVPAYSMMTQNTVPWFVSNAPHADAVPVPSPATPLGGEFNEDLFIMHRSRCPCERAGAAPG